MLENRHLTFLKQKVYIFSLSKHIYCNGYIRILVMWNTLID